MLAARIERNGRDNALAWARPVAGNFARPPQGGDSKQIRAVATGACLAAIVNHDELLRFRTSGDPADTAIADALGAVVPGQRGQGAHANISGAGVSAPAQRKAEAVELLEFLISQRAQRVFAERGGEFPIRPNTELTPALTGLGRHHGEQIPFDALARREAEAASVYQEAGRR